MDRTRKPISHRLVDGYGAGGAVVRRRIGWIGLPVRICAIGGVAFSVSIPLHFDDVFTMSLVLHVDKGAARCDALLVASTWSSSCVSSPGGREKAVGQVGRSRISERLELVSR